MDLRDYWSVWRVLGHFPLLICCRNRLSILLEWFASAKHEYISSEIALLHFATATNDLKITIFKYIYMKAVILRCAKGVYLEITQPIRTLSVFVRSVAMDFVPKLAKIGAVVA